MEKKQLFSHSFTFGEPATALSSRQLFNEALQHFRQGNLQQTHSLLAGIIENNPDHTDTLNLMGVIESTSGHRRHDPLYHCPAAAGAGCIVCLKPVLSGNHPHGIC